MPLSTEGRHVVQNRIDYLKRRAQYIIDGAREDIARSVADIKVAGALVEEAMALEADLEADARL